MGWRKERTGEINKRGGSGNAFRGKRTSEIRNTKKRDELINKREEKIGQAYKRPTKEIYEKRTLKTGESYKIRISDTKETN